MGANASARDSDSPSENTEPPYGCTVFDVCYIWAVEAYPALLQAGVRFFNH